MTRLGSTLLTLAGLSLLACSADPGAPLPAPVETAESTPPPAPAPAPAPSSEAPPVVAACDPSVPRTAPLELFVQPEALSTPFVSVIERASRSIRVMVYQMGYGPILEALEAKAKAGVKVQIILDLAQKSVNQKYMDRLRAAGADVIWSDPKFTYMHAKVIVGDDREAVISTGNYHESFVAKERNFAVVDRDPADVAVLARLFDADFTRATPDVSCTRLLVAPENGKDRLLALIASARKEILVESMQLAEREVRAALAARKAAGVTVRVLLADPSWIDANADAATFLGQNAIPTRHLRAPSVHVKAIVVDGARAYVGSLNFSFTSLEKNREVGLIVDEAANVARAADTFEKDWAAATPF